MLNIPVIKGDINKALKLFKRKFKQTGILKKVRDKKTYTKLMDNKLLTIRAAENVIRILPPLNVKKEEINIAIKIIKKVCSTYK
jgi:acetylornithine/N-succinyldiaminopimelate aminotransferase